MADVEFCQKIAEGILDEIKAQKMYEKMIDLAPTNSEKRTLRKIQKEEYQHMVDFYELFEQCTQGQETLQMEGEE